MLVRVSRRLMPALLMAFLAAACSGHPTPVTLVPSPTRLPSTATSTPFKTIRDTPTPAAVPQVDFSGVSFYYDPALGGTYGAIVPDDDGSAVTSDAVLPARYIFTGVNYPLTKSDQQSVIMVIPVDAIAAINPGAAKRVDALKKLLAEKPTADKITGGLPQISDLSDDQMFFAQLKYVDFKSGSGVRFISEYSTDVRPINNADLVYQFQGLTSDGKYLVAVNLPLSQKDLIKDEDSLTNSQAAAILQDINKYIADTSAALDKADDGSYTPTLTLLDSLVASISISGDLKLNATQPPDQADTPEPTATPGKGTPGPTSTP